MARPLVCFDIDGTLVRTRGAGREALDEAFAALHGWPSATEGVHVAGATDDVICRDVAARFGDSWHPERTLSLRDRYLQALAARLADPARTEVLPGLPEVIQAVGEVAEVCLLTGNWALGARMKLDAAHLSRHFAWGVYSEDAVDRDGLVPVARQRARERGLDVSAVVVVGDTVSDVRCARVGGAVAVVVETGFSTVESLRESRPDLQVSNLATGREAFLDLVATLAR